MGTFLVGGTSHEITQAGVPLFTHLDPPDRSVPVAALSYPVHVSSNHDWTVTESADWISVDLLSGSGDGTVNLSLDENTGDEERSAEIQIGDAVHVVTQAGTKSHTLLTPSADWPQADANPIAWEDVAAGTYDGLLRDLTDGKTLLGNLSKLRVSKPKAGSGTGGAVSGAIRLNGRTILLRGTFGADGRLVASLKQKDGSI
ncbi:MAG: BACON domain-containing protein, partial [Verrucomicrobiae bacterium]|nr:BACON domain-containing protein [Verrucomicrobiae bacterium]